MKRNTSISDMLHPLVPGDSQAYLSNAIQVADLLKWILDQSGPAHVMLSSFSLSEEFLRRIFFIRKESLLLSLDIILDFKAMNKTLILWPFIAQAVENCYLADNHSKILLVYNDNWAVAAVMSQNLTRGNRYESAVVSTSTGIFNTLKSQLDFIISRQSVPFHELFAKAVAAN